MNEKQPQVCPVCLGNGMASNFENCSNCHGDGIVWEDE